MKPLLLILFLVSQGWGQDWQTKEADSIFWHAKTPFSLKYEWRAAPSPKIKNTTGAWEGVYHDSTPTPPGYRRVYSGERLDGVKDPSPIEQYEAECYADSTEVGTHDKRMPTATEYLTEITPCWIETDLSPITYWQPAREVCRRPDHWKKVWQHRQPTYEGLKEFIRRRTK
jgi:hypothetical protein